MRRPNQWTLADHGLHLAEPDVRPQPLINGQCSPNGRCDEDDRDRRGSRLHRECRRLTYGYDNRDPPASQIVG
jgi:hypothetical protein